MKLLIVDDEALARLRLRSLIEQLAASEPQLALQVQAEAGNASVALELLQATPVDALLLDIRMPGIDGMQLAARLQQLHAWQPLQPPPAVIFVSAHAEHALQAFELEAVDYLTKPVRKERLLAALQRVDQRLQQRQQPAPGAAAQPGAPDAVLIVTDRGRTLRIPLAEVLYLRAEQKSLILRTPDHSHIVDGALSDLEQRLHELGGDFLRVHRNALVARRAIRALELRGYETDGWAVRVAPLDEWLSVSRRQVVAVRAALEAPAA